MSWIVFADFPLTDDLSQLNKALNHHNIPHRFTEENGQQRLWLEGPQYAEAVKDIMHAVQNGGFEFSQTLDEASQSPVSASSLNIFAVLITCPVTVVLIVLGVLGFLAFYFRLVDVLNFLLYSPDMLAQGQFWRAVTPAFIHFDFLHIIFNGLWIWVLGKRLEQNIGSLTLLLLSLVTAITANMAQNLVAGSILFGGLSGVVYAYFGSIFVLNYFRPAPENTMPKGIYVVMLVMLVAGFAGIFHFFVGKNVANWAHLGGLLGGIAFALLYLLVTPVKRK